MARLAVRALMAVKFNSTEEAAAADFKHGALSVVADSANREAAFHKFLGVDAAPIGWGCTLLASVMAAVQVRVAMSGGAHLQGRGATALPLVQGEPTDAFASCTRHQPGTHPALLLCCSTRLQIFLQLKYYSAPKEQVRARRPVPCAHTTALSLAPAPAQRYIIRLLLMPIIYSSMSAAALQVGLPKAIYYETARDWCVPRLLPFTLWLHTHA